MLNDSSCFCPSSEQSTSLVLMNKTHWNLSLKLQSYSLKIALIKMINENVLLILVAYSIIASLSLYLWMLIFSCALCWVYVNGLSIERTRHCLTDIFYSQATTCTLRLDSSQQGSAPGSTPTTSLLPRTLVSPSGTSCTDQVNHSLLFNVNLITIFYFEWYYSLFYLHKRDVRT